MSVIPNCRTDEDYNESKLVGSNKERIIGYDFAVEDIDNLFDNLDSYKDEFDIESEDINLITFLGNHKKIANELREMVKHWAEMKRNELITSMIDNM